MQKKALCCVLAVTLNAGFVNAADDDTLVVWGARDTDQLALVGQKFEEDFGIKLVIEKPSEPERQFLVVAGSGGGPDIFFFAHDRIGEYVNGGLLSEIKPSKAIKNANVAVGWEAVSFNGQYWGYPISSEAIGLVYNKDLIAQPPKTFEELFKLNDRMKSKGVETIAWDYANAYFSYPLFAANGGYVFKRTAEGFDTANVGVDSASFRTGAQYIKDLIDQGVMMKDTDYGVMDSKFNEGKVAMMINGPWSWGNLEKNGVNYGVAPLPTLNGGTAKPFVGVYSAMINANSTNKAAAIEFLENYLLTEAGLKLWDAHGELGAVTNIAYLNEKSQNPNILALGTSASHGEPMPNIPEMGNFWGAVETATKNFTSGRQSIDEALSVAQQKIVQSL